MTLRDKLKALNAPCRDVDAEIADVFGVPNAHYTASLDAAVELVEREMPGVRCGWERIHSEYWAFVGQGKEAEAHTLPAVTLLLALLAAKGIE